MVVVHCSATADEDIGAKEINIWHLKRGFNQIGYHYIIRRDGTVEKGRDEKVIGAHAAGYNKGSLGVCLIGGLNANDRTKAKNNFTPAQFNALETLLKDIKSRHPIEIIIGHGDLAGVAKACPSFDTVDFCTERNLHKNPTSTSFIKTKRTWAKQTTK